MKKYNELYTDIDVSGLEGAKTFAAKGNITLITHTDIDGLGCRYMLDGSVEECIHVDYKDADDIIGAWVNSWDGVSRLLLTDFSLGEDVAKMLTNVGVEWFLVDHHKSTKALVIKYPDNVWLESNICSTEQVWLLTGGNKETEMLANLIGIGDLFRDEDEAFWSSRELTSGLIKLSLDIKTITNKKERYEMLYAYTSRVLTNIPHNIQLTPSIVEDINRDCMHDVLGELETSVPGDSIALMLVKAEAKGVTNTALRVGNTAYVDDTYAANFSSLTKLVFDTDTNLKYIIKIGVKGSISARGSKHHICDVSLLGSNDTPINGHLLAGGGFNASLATPKGDAGMLKRNASSFNIL